jgi:hypothetical protein
MKNQLRKILYALSLILAFVLGGASLSVLALTAEEPASAVSSLEGLLEAIETAESGDTIIIAGTINVFESQAIGSPEKELTLKRADTLTSDPMLIVFPFGDDGQVVFQNLTFDGANIRANQEAVTLYQTAAFEKVSFVNCVSDGWSGAVNVQSGIAQFRNCLFLDNQGSSSGHMFVADSAAVSIYDSQFTRGQTVSVGGAIRNAGTLHLYNCGFNENNAESGGALYNSKLLYIDTCTFRDNQAPNGGAIYNIVGECEISGGTLTKNSAKIGGGIFSVSALKISDTTIYRNSASSGASDVYSTASLSLEQSDNIFHPEDLTSLGWFEDSFDMRFDGASNVTQTYPTPIHNEDGRLCLIYVFEEDIPEESAEPEEPMEPEDPEEPQKPDEGDTPSQPDDTDDYDNSRPDENNGHPSENQPDDNQSPGNHDKNTEDSSSNQNESTPKQFSESNAPVVSGAKAALDKTSKAYLQGYADALTDSNAPMTRAQMAKIIFRMLTDDSRMRFCCEVDAFKDISESPDRIAINTLAKAGIVLGYDGKYRPNAGLTRAEMATILSRFSNIETGTSKFTDISGHWGEDYINICVSAGWIKDGEIFSPNEVMRCNEVLTLISETLQ